MFTRVGADPIRAALAAGIGPHIVGATGRPVEPPRARIVKHPKRKSARRKAKFRFTANEPVVFQCKLDRHAWKTCGATFAKRVGRGKHRFKLRAIDSLGQVDPTPAKWRWKVKRRRRGGVSQASPLSRAIMSAKPTSRASDASRALPLAWLSGISSSITT
jgi:hypothetical protein